MSRQVKLFVENSTKGTRTEIGSAVLIEVAGGDLVVDLDITNPDVAKQLGGATVQGIIPKRNRLPDAKTN